MSFSLKFGSVFNVMRDNPSALFRLKLYMLLTKVAYQNANFQACHCSYYQFIHVIFGTNSQFLFKFCVIWTKRANQSANSKLSTAHVKFYQVFTLIAKKVQRSYVSWIWKVLAWALKSLKNLHVDCFLLCNVFNVWPKKVQRSYLSWQWRMMQNFKNNWLVVWKNDMRNLVDFHQSIWKCQNWDFDWILLSKEKVYELKNYREIMCHGNGEWYKNWRGIDLLFQHEDFDVLWPKHLKI